MKLTWTTDTPTKPGYYWHTVGDDPEPDIVWISIDTQFQGDVLMFHDMDGECTPLEHILQVNPNISMRIRWAGPIPEPEEP